VDNEKTHTFGYDDLNRIKTSSIQNEAYAYDLRGNRNTLQTDKPLNHNTVEYQHDIYDRLSKVVTANEETIEYKYNGKGLMEERTENGVTKRYYYDGKDIIAEAVVKSDQSVELKTRYLRGIIGLIARISEEEEEKASYGGVAYYHNNHHGDVISLRDKSGNVLNSYVYDIWGNIQKEGTFETIDNPFTYSGEYRDKTTSLQYLRARWYDPSMGRFISEDKYEGELSNPLSLNRYTYVENNPLIYVDPDGDRKRGIDFTWAFFTFKYGLHDGAYYDARRDNDISDAEFLKGVGIKYSKYFKAKKRGNLLGKLDGFKVDERKVVNDLLEMGKDVKPNPESRENGVKSFDFWVNGVPTELKTANPPSGKLKLNTA
jgi:RHS repeat-associated protein